MAFRLRCGFVLFYLPKSILQMPRLAASTSVHIKFVKSSNDEIFCMSWPVKLLKNFLIFSEKFTCCCCCPIVLLSFSYSLVFTNVSMVLMDQLFNILKYEVIHWLLLSGTFIFLEGHFNKVSVEITKAL